MLTLERLQAILLENFGPPFLEDGFVRATFLTSAGEKTLQVNIGRRDVWISADGEVTAAGTCLV